MSVGTKTIEGIERLTSEYSFPEINLLYTLEINDPSNPIFAHANLGENGAPETKIDAFVSLMDSGLADRVDIAFLKFCYADVKVKTDVNQLFNYYTSQINSLKDRHPGIDFIHFTVPLKSKPSGVKGIIKNIINYDHNINRNKFNQLLRNYYAKDDICDIAEWESTYPNGDMELYKKERYALVPAYTYDGGHFNEFGSKIIAEKFLLFLSSRIQQYE
jgi:hypothetical protein